MVKAIKNGGDMHMHEQVSSNGKTTLTNKILLICVALLAIAIVAITVFKVSPGSLLYIGLFLACPLLHILMMRGGGHKH